MNKEVTKRVVEFVSDRWVSWLIEILILGTIAFFTISETRRTAEQTREMLARYDAAISGYTAQKAQKIDESAGNATEALKEKLKNLSKEDIKEFFENENGN
ncbi:MAG: hypothetical protein AB3N63_03550 [Puniceicoccaceae bacterium]